MDAKVSRYKYTNTLAVGLIETTSSVLDETASKSVRHEEGDDQ